METNVSLKEIVERFGCARNLARLSGVSTSILSRVLAGERQLGLKVAQKLARTAKVDLVIRDNGIFFAKRQPKKGVQNEPGTLVGS